MAEPISAAYMHWPHSTFTLSRERDARASLGLTGPLRSKLWCLRRNNFFMLKYRKYYARRVSKGTFSTSTESTSKNSLSPIVHTFFYKIFA